MAKKVLCVGLVCLDIVAETESFPIEDTDQRYCQLKNIHAFNRFTYLSFLIWDSISDLCFRRGGNASNSSTVLAQLGLATEFLGTLSKSIELDFIVKDFSANAVCTENCPIVDGCEFPTSMVIINSSNGSRTILHHPKNLPELSIQNFSIVNLDEYNWIHFEVSQYLF